MGLPVAVPQRAAVVLRDAEKALALRDRSGGWVDEEGTEDGEGPEVSGALAGVWGFGPSGYHQLVHSVRQHCSQHLPWQHLGDRFAFFVRSAGIPALLL